jgi:hypothetical protein
VEASDLAFSEPPSHRLADTVSLLAQKTMSQYRNRHSLSGTSLEIPAAATVRPQCLIPTFLMNMAAKLQMGHLARVMLPREGDLRNDQF